MIDYVLHIFLMMLFYNIQSISVKVLSGKQLFFSYFNKAFQFSENKNRTLCQNTKRSIKETVCYMML